MHRLPQFQHHVIGDIDHRVNAADAAAPQALEHPQGRFRLGIDGTNDPACVAAAGVAGAQADRQLVRDGRRHRRDREIPQRGTQHCRNFPGKPADTEAVAAIRCQVDLDHFVVERQNGAQIGAGAEVSGQLEQPGLVGGESQFGRRAEHALGFNAAQFGSGNGQLTGQTRPDRGERGLQTQAGIGRSTDHLHLCIATNADAADPQLIGIGMRFHGQDLADHDLGKRRRSRLHAVHFEPRHGETRHQVGRGDLDVHMLQQPGFAEFHRVLKLPGSKLLQKTQVILEKQPQIADAVTQHGQALHTHAKRKAREIFRIDTAIGEHIGMHHPATHDFEPAALFADPAARAPALSALNIHFRRWLGERKIGRPEAHRQIGFKKGFQELIDRSSQVRKTDVAVDHQPFDLMKHRRVCEIRIAAINPPRTHDADRRRLALHGANLHRRSMGAQNMSGVDVERIVHRARGMVRGNIECFEVVIIVFDFRTFLDLIANPNEKILDPVERLGDGMQAADFPIAARQGHVDGFGGKAPLDIGRGETLPARLDPFLHRSLGLVDARARRRPLLRRQGAESLQHGGQHTLFAQVTDPHRFERRQGLGTGYGGHRFGYHSIEIIHDSARCIATGAVLEYLAAATPTDQKKRGKSAPFPPYFPRRRAAGAPPQTNAALARAATVANAALSCTARSASTRRSSSILARFRPATNRL